MDTCSWIAMDADKPCGDEVEGWNHGSYLCSKHLGQRLASKGTAFRQGSEYFWPEELPGFCYVLELPDGTFKIGMSWTEKNLEKRLKSHEKTYPGHVVRRVFPGGAFTEAQLHKRFAEYRIPGTSELFRGSLDLEELLDDPAEGGYTPMNPVDPRDTF